jgi:hypothetical protein
MYIYIYNYISIYIYIYMYIPENRTIRMMPTPAMGNAVCTSGIITANNL